MARHEYAAGIIASAVVNVMGMPKTALEPSDFFASRWARDIRRRKQAAERDHQRIADAFRMLMARAPKAEGN
jgi:hypothetical protein